MSPLSDVPQSAGTAEFYSLLPYEIVGSKVLKYHWRKPLMPEGLLDLWRMRSYFSLSSLSLNFKVRHPQAWQKENPNFQEGLPFSLPSAWKLCSPGPHFHLLPNGLVIELRTSSPIRKPSCSCVSIYFTSWDCWWRQKFPIVSTFFLIE